MGILNYIIFGGVDSRDYGIYISGEGVFNAPERDVEVVNIPGKDGDLLIDRGRFLNIQVTYPGFNFEPGLSTFAERLRAFRAALASQVGYQRLEDSFHPDEFRLASFRSGLDINPVMYNTASTFDIVFDCKPQRFLKSGEEEITIGEWGETETASGSITTFEAEADTGIKSLLVDIDYNADGITDVSITRTEKNLAIIPQSLLANDRVHNGITWHATGKSSWHVSGSSTGLSANLGSWSGNHRFLPKGTYTVTVSYSGTVSGTANIWGYDRANTTNRRLVAIARWNTPQTFTLEEDTWYVMYASIGSGKTVDADVFIQIEQGSTGTDWESSEGEYVTKELGQTVYGGTLDLISGVLTSTLNADGTQKATPEVIQLTGEQVQTLLGVNNIWADSGEVSVEYGDDPNILVNPTLFEALPLIEVTGQGSLFVDGEEIVISGNDTKYIDSEIMEVYAIESDEVVSKNDQVVLSEFPKLGKDTRITYSGLSSVKVTPRWWTI